MKRLIIVVLVMVMVGSLFGVKVVLNNGVSINGKFRGKSYYEIYVYLETEEYFVKIKNDYISTILDDNNNDITQQVFQRNNFTYNVDFKICKDIKETDLLQGRPLHGHNYKNKYNVNDYNFNPAMFAIVASLVVLAWDSFAEAGDISDTIKDYKELGLKTSKLEDTRSRKNAFGAVLIVSSLITLRYSFKKVEVQASPTSLSLSYKF